MVGEKSTLTLLSVDHDSPDRIHLYRDLDMLVEGMVSLDLKVVRYDDIHPSHLGSEYSINSNSGVVEAEDHKSLREDQSRGVGDLVEQSRMAVYMSLMRGSEEDLLMKVDRCMIGMDQRVEGEKLKRRKRILVVAVEEHIDLLESRGIQTWL